MATDLIPNSLHARNTRIAISPLFHEEKHIIIFQNDIIIIQAII